MDGSERTLTFLHMHLKIGESLLQGDSSRDQQARRMWRAGDNREQNRIWEGGQQAGQHLQGQGAQISMLQLSLVSPGQKYRCLSLNQTQMSGANGLPMVTHWETGWACTSSVDRNYTQVSAEGTRAKTNNAVSVWPFNLNKAIGT